jgi:hypothetical protein
MKKTICIVVVLAALACTSAWAQTAFVINARELGMGFAGVAVADDAAAVYQNPAGLACLAIKGDPGQSFVNDIAATYLDNTAPPNPNVTREAISWAGFAPASGWGLGAFFGTLDLPSTTFKSYGVGAGKALWNTRFTLGLSFTRMELGFLGSGNEFVGGVMFGRPGDCLKAGLRIIDVTQQLGDMTFDAGLAWQINRRWLLAADGIDVTEKYSPISYNVGTEYCINSNWTARLGASNVSDDARWAGGLGFHKDGWRLDAGYANLPADTFWNITGGVTF